MRTEKKIWFPAKEYGWGWSFPNTWQGWIVCILWSFAMISVSVLMCQSQLGFGYLIIFWALMTVLLIAICIIRGEKPRWRWGDKDKS